MAKRRVTPLGCLSFIVIFGALFFMLVDGAFRQVNRQESQKIVIDGVSDHRGKANYGGRSQIIAITQLTDEAELMQAASKLHVHYGYTHSLVSFYSDPSTISRFDGSGLIIAEGSYLGRVSISGDDVTFTPTPF